MKKVYEKPELQLITLVTNSTLANNEGGTDGVSGGEAGVEEW